MQKSLEAKRSFRGATEVHSLESVDAIVQFTKWDLETVSKYTTVERKKKKHKHFFFEFTTS